MSSASVKSHDDQGGKGCVIILAHLDHFSNYNDWTLLINLDINEGWNVIKNRICDGMIKFIPKVTIKNNKDTKPKWINNKVKRSLQNIYILQKIPILFEAQLYN